MKYHNPLVFLIGSLAAYAVAAVSRRPVRGLKCLVALIVLAIIMTPFAWAATPNRHRDQALAALALASSHRVVTPASKCRCGDACPLGGNCIACGCAEPRPTEPPGRPGPEWNWDADGKFWWRYGGVEGVAAPTAPVAVTPVATIQPQARFTPSAYSAPVPFRSPAPMMSRAACVGGG